MSLLTMNTSEQAKAFFKFWMDACGQRREVLSRDLSNAPLFTAHVLNERNSIIDVVAAAMNLRCYSGYYSIDAVLFKDPEDLVPNAPPGTTWIRRIRVAFEHENFFNSGLFTEVSHLLITDCDLRVLVSYPESEDDLDYQLKYLHEIIAGTDRSKQISEASSFLFIVDTVGKRLEWQAYVYRSDAWQSLPP